MPNYTLPKQLHPDFAFNIRPSGPTKPDQGGIAEGLRGAWVFSSFANKVADSVSAHHAVVSGGTWSPKGPLLDTNGDDVTVDGPQVFDSLMTGGTHWSLLVKGIHVGTAGSDDVWHPFFYINGTAQPTDLFMLEFKTNFSTNNWRAFVNDDFSGFTPATGDFIGSGNIETIVIARWDGTNLTIDEPNTTQGTSAVGVGDYSGTAPTEGVIAYSNGQDFTPDCVLYWERALLDSEVEDLFRNPYQPLAPHFPMFYTVPSAGGNNLPTFQNYYRQQD